MIRHSSYMKLRTQYIPKKILTVLLTLSVLSTLAIIVPVSIQTAQAKTIKKVDLTCMQAAVDTREDAIADAFATFNTDVEEALASRKTALHDAWGMEDGKERNAEIKEIWKTWKSDHKAAFKVLKEERKEAWTTFKSTVKTDCKETLPKEESLSTDGSGSVAL